MIFLPIAFVYFYAFIIRFNKEIGLILLRIVIEYRNCYLAEVQVISVISSMTGYGKGKVEQDGWEFIAEIKSLNNRYLDINLRLPRNLSYLEEDLRKLAQQNLSRGRIEITLLYLNADSDSMEVVLNEPLAAAYMNCFTQLSERFNLENNLSVSAFVSLPEILITRKKDENTEVLKKLAADALQQAIINLKAMKLNEGEKLSLDILERIRMIGNYTGKIKERAPVLVEDYRQKLKDRLKELINQTEVDELRFNSEVAYFAERSSITEELVRLESHLVQFEQILDFGGSVGRKLDFLVQEINREINTISSKVGDLAVVNMVVEIKSEIEKIREQIQNIE